jgi:HTH-type transcriptional regulator/antitoxin HigA
VWVLRSPSRAEETARQTQTKKEAMMAVRTKFKLQARVRDSYLELVQAFPLASIRSDEHFKVAQRVIDGLLAEGELNEGEEMYLDALGDLVAGWEDESHAIEPASDADMLRHFLEAKSITQAQLSRDTGISKSTISEALAGKKPFSRQIIRKLADYFDVDVSVLAVNL